MGLKQIYPNCDLVNLMVINTLNKVSMLYFQIVRLAFSISVLMICKGNSMILTSVPT